MQYVANVYYRVLVLTDGQDTFGRGREYNLRGTNPAMHDFNSEQEAEKWIQTDGRRQTSYTILKIYKKD